MYKILAAVYFKRLGNRKLKSKMADENVNPDQNREKNNDIEMENIRRRQNAQNSSRKNVTEPSETMFDQIPTVQTYKNAREYAQALTPWLQHYRLVSQMNAFHSMMPLHLQHMSCMSNANMPGVHAGASNVNHQQSQHSTSRRQTTATSTTGTTGSPSPQQDGVLYRVPTFWRRVAAELIDFTLLFYIKLIVTLFVMKRFGHLYDVVDYQELFTMEDLDYDKAFAITYEVIAMEMINRMLITVFETLCLRHGIGTVGGSTPGKRLMGLRLISGKRIVDQGNGLILVSPATDVGWTGAFVRSMIKNFTIAFFLPACLTLFFHSHNRTIYDVVTKTIVVQNADRHQR